VLHSSKNIHQAHNWLLLPVSGATRIVFSRGGEDNRPHPIGTSFGSPHVSSG
jgi:hypothetical protein